MDAGAVTIAREHIRDLVARYNANGDSGRFEQVLELFAPDAVMEIAGESIHRGIDDIRSVFTGAREQLQSATDRGYVRHFTATHQIDVLDDTHARGRCYFAVLTPIGLDHWGRYIDRYVCETGRWLFAERIVQVDDHAPGSLYRDP